MEHLNSTINKKERLTRDQMKKIVAGDGCGNPNCGDICNDTDHYYCCFDDGDYEDLGSVTCCNASDQCATLGGYKVTNDSTRCAL